MKFIDKIAGKVAGMAGFKLVKKESSSGNTSKRSPEKDDFTDFHKAIMNKVMPFTMTSPERIYGIIEGIKYLSANNIEGDIVECGVWKGGSMMAAALTLNQLNDTNRKIYLFDTYEDGMTEPGIEDLDFTGQHGKTVLKNWESNNSYPTLEIVRGNLQSTNYPAGNLKFIKGKVEETLLSHLPDKIAMLRLDTDWYESTKLELEVLFPLLNVNGILIVDDYGHWAGSRKAVDEYISKHKVPLFLSRMDYTGRIAVKTATNGK